MKTGPVGKLVGAVALLAVAASLWVGFSVYEDREEQVRDRSTGQTSEISVICNSVIAGGDERDELPPGVEMVGDPCKESSARRVWFGLGILVGGAWVVSALYARRRRAHS